VMVNRLQRHLLIANVHFNRVVRWELPANLSL
jgi:hypothetical protein